MLNAKDASHRFDGGVIIDDLWVGGSPLPVALGANIAVANGVDARIVRTPLTRAPQPASTVVSTFQSGSGWVANGAGATYNLFDTTDFVRGSQAMSMITTGTGTNAQIKKTALGPLDCTGKDIRITFKVDDWTHVSDVRLMVSSDDTFTNWSYAQLKDTNSINQYLVQSGEWVVVTIPWSTFVLGAGTGAVRNSISAMEFRIVDDNTGNTRVGRINAIELVPSGCTSGSLFPSGVVTFWFDDGWDTQFTIAKQNLDLFGWAGTASTITNAIGTASHVTLAQLHQMHDYSGWEIAAHAYTQANHDIRFDNLAFADLEAEFAQQQAWLYANGFGDGAHTYAYPGGQYSLAMLPTVAKYFRVARTISQLRAETVMPTNPLRLAPRGYAYPTPTVTLANLKALVDATAANGDWLIFVFHKLTAAGTGSIEWAISDFQALTTYIAGKSGMKVLPVRDVLASGWKL